MVDDSVCDDGLKQGYSNDKSQNKTDKTAITEFLIFIETIAICFFLFKMISLYFMVAMMMVRMVIVLRCRPAGYLGRP